MDIEEKLGLAIQTIADLQARQAASDAVMTWVLTALLARTPEPLPLLTSMREDFVVSAEASDATATADAEIVKLKTEQFIQDLIDRIEKALR